MKMEILQAGYCTHSEKAINPHGGFKSIKFPASVVHIDHPTHGHILFDTGYSEEFYRATSKLPEKIYALVTPVFVNEFDKAAGQLKRKGISNEDVKYIIISHFHADHVGALRDFPCATFIFLDRAYKNVASLNRWRRLKAAFLKDLLPEDFTSRVKTIDETKIVQGIPELSMFEQVFDIFKDGSLFAVSMPGHAPGHIGLFVQMPTKKYLFAADSCYTEDHFKLKIKINPIIYLIVDKKDSYLETINILHKTYKNFDNLEIIPCHCSKSVDRNTI